LYLKGGILPLPRLHSNSKLKKTKELNYQSFGPKNTDYCSAHETSGVPNNAYMGRQTTRLRFITPIIYGTR